METKTIVLSEKEGKRYELDLMNDMNHHIELHYHYRRVNKTTLFSGNIDNFNLLPNKEEIAERVCGRNSKIKGRVNTQNLRLGPLPKLLSAIGEYKYIIITETEI